VTILVCRLLRLVPKGAGDDSIFISHLKQQSVVYSTMGPNGYLPYPTLIVTVH
jgi:hypothetical protein